MNIRRGRRRGYPQEDNSSPRARTWNGRRAHALPSLDKTQRPDTIDADLKQKFVFRGSSSVPRNAHFGVAEDGGIMNAESITELLSSADALQSYRSKNAADISSFRELFRDEISEEEDINIVHDSDAAVSAAIEIGPLPPSTTFADESVRGCFGRKGTPNDGKDTFISDGTLYAQSSGEKASEILSLIDQISNMDAFKGSSQQDVSLQSLACDAQGKTQSILDNEEENEKAAEEQQLRDQRQRFYMELEEAAAKAQKTLEQIDSGDVISGEDRSTAASLRSSFVRMSSWIDGMNGYTGSSDTGGPHESQDIQFYKETDVLQLKKIKEKVAALEQKINIDDRLQ